MKMNRVQDLGSLVVVIAEKRFEVSYQQPSA
jgi:hypothetical protein